MRLDVMKLDVMTENLSVDTHVFRRGRPPLMSLYQIFGINYMIWLNFIVQNIHLIKILLKEMLKFLRK